jgi:hypothetical protein
MIMKWLPAAALAVLGMLLVTVAIGFVAASCISAATGSSLNGGCTNSYPLWPLGVAGLASFGGAWLLLKRATK